MSTQTPIGSNTKAGGGWGGGPGREGGGAIKGFEGNFLALISGNGEPLWILEQRKTVFNEDNSSSCVEDSGEGGGEASQSPALRSSHGNGNEDERKQCRGRAGSTWCRLEVHAFGNTASGNQCQDHTPLATMETLERVGHWNGEWRRTLGLYSFFFFPL